jgi:anti-sigma B factor antagonist
MAGFQVSTEEEARKRAVDFVFPEWVANWRAFVSKLPVLQSFERHSDPPRSPYLGVISTIQPIGSWRGASMPKRVGSMKLKIEQRERERVVILDLKGSLVVGEEDLSLLQRLLFLLDSRQRQVILNLKEVSDIDESGLDTVAFCATRFCDIGGRLVLVDLGQPHAKVADISKLSNVSETYQEEIEAVNSFFSDPVVPRRSNPGIETLQARKV